MSNLEIINVRGVNFENVSWPHPNLKAANFLNADSLGELIDQALMVTKTIDVTVWPNLERFYVGGYPEFVPPTGIKTLNNLWSYVVVSCPKANTIDLAGMTKISRVYGYSCRLTSIDLSGCTALENVRLYSNTTLTGSLDLSFAENLSYLSISNTKISSLDISGIKNPGAFYATNVNPLTVKVWSMFNFDDPASNFPDGSSIPATTVLE